MAFDGITVAAVVKELQETITDSRIARISQPENRRAFADAENKGRPAPSLYLGQRFSSTDLSYRHQ